MSWGLTELKGRNMKATLCRLSWSAAAYHIWRQRNGTKHCNPIRSDKKIVQSFLWEVRAQAVARGRFKKTKEIWSCVAVGEFQIRFLQNRQS
jgi:hypothetical protein